MLPTPSLWKAVWSGARIFIVPSRLMSMHVTHCATGGHHDGGWTWWCGKLWAGARSFQCEANSLQSFKPSIRSCLLTGGASRRRRSTWWCARRWAGARRRRCGAIPARGASTTPPRCTPLKVRIHSFDRRKIIWGAYTCEILAALATGRPPQEPHPQCQPGTAPHQPVPAAALSRGVLDRCALPSRASTQARHRAAVCKLLFNRAALTKPNTCIHTRFLVWHALPGL